MTNELSKPVLNLLFSEESTQEIARKLGRERLSKIREAFLLQEIPWLSNRALFEYIAKSPVGVALFKCWMTMDFEYDENIDAPKQGKKPQRVFETFVDLIEYRLWFSVLDTSEIYLLCEVFGWPLDKVPNRKIGAKVLAPILHKIKFGTDEEKISPERSANPEAARGHG